MIELCVEMRSTTYMLVNIDFVPFHANYASGCVAGTIYMAWLLTKATYAGMFAISLFLGSHSFESPRQEHSCSALCSAPGICQIDTTPQSIEATFTGRHETFQYTKVTLTSSRRYTDFLMMSLVHPRFVSCYSSFSLLSVHYFSCEAAPLRQDDRA
jgi:hypothetical protein